MGGRLVELLTVDMGKRRSDSSALTAQLTVWGRKDRERRATMMTDKCVEMVKSFKCIYVRRDIFNLT